MNKQAYFKMMGLVKKADFYQKLDQKPITDKNLRLTKEQAKQLLATILKDYKQNKEYFDLGDNRDLYLAGVTRYNKDPKFAEWYPDIRDRKDPDFRYDQAAGHYISWQPGTNYLQYNG